MQKMDHKKCLAKLLLYFGILHYLPRAACQEEALVGDTVTIVCKVNGTFNLPQWTFGLVTVTIQGNPNISPAFTRLQYASDQKNLILTNAQLNDSGNYVCTHTLGIETTSLTVKETTTTQPENPDICIVIIEICCKIIKAICAFFVLGILVHTVVIIKCSHILIEEHKRQKEENGKHRVNNGQNGCSGTEVDRNMEHKLLHVWVIIITAAVIFIAVSVWFIVMQATDEDCEEICECKVHIGLLAFEVVDFVLGVGFVIYLFYRDYPTCDQCGGGKKPPPSGPSAAVKHTAEINPDPLVKPKSGDTGPHYPDVSPQHRPQPALPPKERHGSDLSSVSRRDVKLDPIPPIRKNISTTEFHMDNPESERSNIKVSSRGLSAVFDPEYDQPPTNRLAPIDHTVRDESIRRKKKKKKTRTNNDNVKFDNDYD